jgi:exonuclease SbcC
MIINNAIKSIETQNFQSHANTKIDIAPAGQLTVIVGPSDSGKSALLRAMRWLFSNFPQGTDFIRAKCSFARETIHYESGHTVIRERTRTASKNQYKIVTPGTAEPLIFEGFGNAVPFEAQEITGVRPVTIGDLKLNLNVAEQLDGPFLGNSMSAGARAKVIGKLSGNEEIDFANKELGTDLHRRNQDEKRLRAEVDQLIETIATYDYLPKLAEKIAAVDQMVASLKSKRERLNQLVESQGKLAQLKICIDQCNIIVERLKFLGIAENVVADVAAKVNKIQRLQVHKAALEVLQSGITGAQQTIEKLKSITLADNVVAKIDPAITKLNQLSSQRNQVNLLETAINGCNAAIDRLGNVNKAEAVIQDAVTTQERFDQLMVSDLMLTDIEISIGLLVEKVEKLTGINQAESTVSDISVKLERLNKLRSLSNTVKPLSIAIEDRKESIVQWEQRVVELDTKYHEELNALGVCPLCGNILSSKAS